MVTRLIALQEQLIKLEQRLASLERKKLIAGNDLRVTELNENLLLIERVPDDRSAESFIERLEQAEESLQEHLSSDWIIGEGLTATNNGMRKVIEVDPAFLERSQVKAEPETSVSGDFPFRVRLSDDQPESGTARNFLLCAGGYDLPEALVYAGTAEPIRIDKHIFQADRDSCIFLRFDLDPPPSEHTPGTLNVSVEQDASFPVPSAAVYIVPIAKIIFGDTGITIQQMQFGNVYLAGRVI